MSLTEDIKTSAVAQILARARNEFQKESTEQAVAAFKAQLKRVAAAEAVLKAEQLKLNDLERQIQDGTFR